VKDRTVKIISKEGKISEEDFFDALVGKLVLY